MVEEIKNAEVIKETNESKKKEGNLKKVGDLTEHPKKGGVKPLQKWEEVTTTLGELNTSKLHYVKLPENHIVIDFDIKNEKGEKDASLNIRAAVSNLTKTGRHFPQVAELQRRLWS